MSWEPQKLREWHTQLMDFIILHPRATYEEIAQKFDSHPMTIGMVVRSDLFQAKLAARRASREEVVGDEVLEKLRGLACTSIDSLKERIEKEKLAIAIGEVRETAEMALKGLGYGVKPSYIPAATAPPAVNLQVIVNKDDLSEARQLMRQRAIVSEVPTDATGTEG